MANLRKDNPNRAAARAQWLNTPPAVIQSPLKHIAAASSYKVRGADGIERIEFGPAYHDARRLANAGQGAAVQRIARQVA